MFVYNRIYVHVYCFCYLQLRCPVSTYVPVCTALQQSQFHSALCTITEKYTCYNVNCSATVTASALLLYQKSTTVTVYKYYSYVSFINSHRPSFTVYRDRAVSMLQQSGMHVTIERYACYNRAVCMLQQSSMHLTIERYACYNRTVSMLQQSSMHVFTAVPLI